MEVKEKKVLLFTYEITFNTYKAKEDQVFKIVNDLKVLADASLGLNKIDDWKAFIDNPAEYLVQMYWTLWGEQFNPPHTNKEALFFNSNAIGIERLIELKQNFDTLQLELKEYAPTISKGGLTSNLKKEMFNKYLNPAMEQEYNACISFIEASNRLKPYNATAMYHLQRFYSDGLRMDGIEIKPNLYRFAL